MPRGVAESLRDVGATDLVVALFFAAVLWLPPLAGHDAYEVALAILVAYAAFVAVRERRFPPVPIALVAYAAVYAAATIHGTGIDAIGLGSLKHGYFVRPLTAIAVATIATMPLQRLRVLAMVVLFGLTQVAVTAVQAGENVVHYGRHATDTASVDAVTGSLAWPGSPHQSSTVTMVALIAAMVLASAWLWGALPGRVAVVLAAGLLAVGAFSSTRASPVFALLVAGAIAAAALALRQDRAAVSRILTFGLASVVAAGGIVAVTLALYSGAYKGIAKENQGTQSVAVTKTGGPAARKAHRVRTFSGASLRPGRVVQLRLAVRLSLHSGLGIGLLGRGPGSSDIGNERYAYAQQVPLAKRTGTTWVGKVLTETGWLGLAAFVGLLVWLVVWGIKLCRAAPKQDRVLGLVLVGLAALTGATAAYGTFPTIAGYAVLFWPLVGLGISAERDRRRRVAAPAPV